MKHMGSPGKNMVTTFIHYKLKNEPKISECVIQIFKIFFVIYLPYKCPFQG